VTAQSLGRRYFDELYAGDPDPWRFATSAYERDKYLKTLAALPHPRYAAALEVGCSIGVLTRMLADRCERLLAVDISSLPLLQARRRCGDAPWVDFAEMEIPREWPGGSFDLILLSEVVYYLNRADVRILAGRLKSSLMAGGDLLLVHWLGATNYPLSGDEAADFLLSDLGSAVVKVRRDEFEHFRLDAVRRSEASA
jgi:SAM-dependent methyltransferase